MKSIDGGKAYARELVGVLGNAIDALQWATRILADATGEIAADRERFKSMEAELERISDRYLGETEEEIPKAYR